MNTTTDHDFDRARHREAIARIIAHYPTIGEDELHTVLHYFRRVASAYDRAIIASDPEIQRQYRQICHDHRLDRLGKVETAMAAFFVVLLFVGILVLMLGVWG